MDSASPPGAHEVAGGPVCAPYVVGNLKENFKSDTPKENKDKSKSVCVTSKLIQPLQPCSSELGWKNFPLTRSCSVRYNIYTFSWVSKIYSESWFYLPMCLFACAYNGTQSYLQ